VNYEEQFEQFKTLGPKLEHLPDGVVTGFWETLYQMFKARMEAEREKDKQGLENALAGLDALSDRRGRCYKICLKNDEPCDQCPDKSWADAPVSGSPTPRIIPVEGGSCSYYEKCSECGEELLQHASDNGVRMECGKCGHEWWEGEYIKPTVDDSSHDPSCQIRTYRLHGMPTSGLKCTCHRATNDSRQPHGDE